jgi:[acyl-carrier-protein] S-malonyltransferase
VKLAWIFPGQGAQTVGMGKALHETSAKAREVFDRVDAALGWKLSTLCFEGPESDLMLTANTQPAILATSIATLEALREAFPDLPEPTFVAGHSLGEYTALVSAGALSLEDAVQLVHLRGRAMQEAVPAGVGAMAAIMGGTQAQIVEICRSASNGEIVSPANFNAPGQIVIAGHAAAVERAKAAATSAGQKVIPLKVSAPFHCALMAPAAAALSSALKNVTLSTPRVPVVANVNATPNQDVAQIPSLLFRQVDGTVLWEQSVRHMADAGVVRALEIGPGSVLSGLVKRIDKRIATLSVNSRESFDKVPAFLA